MDVRLSAEQTTCERGVRLHAAAATESRNYSGKWQRGHYPAYSEISHILMIINANESSSQSRTSEISPYRSTCEAFRGGGGLGQSVLTTYRLFWTNY